MLQEKLAEIEACLSKHRWVKYCFRVNIFPESMIKECNKSKLALCESNTLRIKEKKIRDLIESIAPEWWGDDTKIVINRTVKCERHRGGNDGISWIIWLGDFSLCRVNQSSWCDLKSGSCAEIFHQGVVHGDCFDWW